MADSRHIEKLYRIRERYRFAKLAWPDKKQNGRPDNTLVRKKIDMASSLLKNHNQVSMLIDRAPV